MNQAEFGLVVGHASDKGRVREINEDSYLTLTPPSTAPEIKAVMMVADGVGGANAGEVASGTLVELFWHWFANNNYGEFVHYNPAHEDYFIAVLKDLLEYANENLYKLANTNSHLSDMGTTGTVGILTRGRLYVGHVGDTRAYLLRQGALRQLTIDHSWVNDELAAGRMSPEQARDHPKRNVVSRVLGASTLLRVDRKAYPVQHNDMLIYTSDGLTGLVNDREMQQIVLASNNPQEACNRLIDLSNERGGQDNITVLISQISSNQNGSNLSNGIVLNSHYLGQSVAQVKPESGSQQVVKRERGQAGPNATRELSVFGGITILAGVLSGIVVLFFSVATAEYAWAKLAHAITTGLLVSMGLWLGYFWRLRYEK
jgi:protein phosphatase